MCFDGESSIKSFGLTLINSIILYYYDYGNLAYCILAIGLIQLAEYFMWIDMKCTNNINKLGNIIAILSLFLQLIVCLYYTKNKTFLYSTYVIYLFVLGNYIYKNMPCSTLTKNNNLKWGFFEAMHPYLRYLFAFYYLIVLLFVYVMNKNYMYSNYFNTYIYSLVIMMLWLYSVKTTNSFFLDAAEWGSVWCHYSNNISIILTISIILKHYYNIYK